jgi:phosphate/sulfate permease
MIWPATGVVAISWVIAIAAFLVAALLFFLAHRTKRLNNRLAAARAKRSTQAS